MSNNEAGKALGGQVLMMMGFGVLAMFQGMQFYRMQKQLEKQNQQILDSARQNTEDGNTTPRKKSIRFADGSDSDEEQKNSRARRGSKLGKGNSFASLAADELDDQT